MTQTNHIYLFIFMPADNPRVTQKPQRKKCINHKSHEWNYAACSNGSLNTNYVSHVLKTTTFNVFHQERADYLSSTHNNQNGKFHWPPEISCNFHCFQIETDILLIDSFPFIIICAANLRSTTSINFHFFHDSFRCCSMVS